MTLVDTISSDMTASMKAGTADRTGVLRLLMTSFKNEQIKLGHELSEDEAMKVVAREAKQRRDSITAYESAERADLADVEKAELAIIETYLPKQLDESAIGDIIDKVMSETGATTRADMGRVMGLVMKQTAGAADGTVVSRLVAQKLK